MKKNFLKFINSKIVKNSFWLSILQIVNTIIPMITIPYITRTLGAEQYGNFSIALNWIVYIQVLVEFGFALNGARKVAVFENVKEEIEKLFNNIISSRILLLVISFILLNILTIVFNYSEVIYICMLLLFTMIIGVAFQLTWLFQGKQDMRFITIINLIGRMISVVLTFVFVKSSKDIYLYCFFYALTTIISSIISLIVVYKKYNLKFKFSKFEDIKNEISEGKYLFISAAMMKIFSGFGITVLGFVESSAKVGIYSAIYKIPYILTLFFSAISQSIYPYVSVEFNKSYNNGIKTVKKLFFPIFFMFFIMSIIIIFLKDFIIDILFGREYLLYSDIVVPLIIQFLFAIVNNFVGVQILLASNKQKIYTKSFTISCICIVICNVILGKMFGLFGIAYAALIGEMILCITLLIAMKFFIKRKDVKEND